MLFVHGVGGSGLIFQPVLQRLGASYEHLRPDLLGYGYSPNPSGDYTPGRHVEALRDTVGAAGIGEPVAIVGLSMGGILALEYAGRFPAEVAGVLVAGLPYYRDEDEARRDLRHNLWTNLALHRPRLARAVMTPLWGLGRRSRSVSKLLAPRMYAGEVARESMMATFHSFSSTLQHCIVGNRIEPLVSPSAVPLAFLHGGDDRWCPPERVRGLLAEHRPDVKLQVIAGCGHNTVVLAPDATAEHVGTFLASLP